MMRRLFKPRPPAAALPVTGAPDNTVLLVMTAALFALYASTAQPVVGFEDSAGFTLACLNSDIAHAPGYPLYSLLCHPFSYLPAESPALAAAWFSAACAAAACAALAHVLYKLTADATTAIGGAALFGLSRTFWSQAVIPEVYTLNVLLFFIALLLLLQWRRQPSALRLAAMIFISALALTNHWPLFLLAAAGFIPLAWGQRAWLLPRLARPKYLLLWGLALAIGLLPYLYLYWRANHPVAFTRLPAAPSDLAALWAIVSRSVFSPAIDNPAGSGWADKAAFAAFLAKQTLAKELGLPGGALIILGFFYQWRQTGAAAALALSLIFAGATAGLVLLLNFLYDGLSAQTFTPYPLLPYAAACAWAALAARRLFAKRRGPALAALCAYALFLNYPVSDRSRDRLAADIADTYLQTLPPGAFFPIKPLYSLLTYRQYTAAARPEVLLLPAPTPYTAYTVTPGEKLYPPNTLSFSEEMAAVDAYAAANPLCYNTYIPFAAPAPSREHLLFSCLREADNLTFIMDARVTDFLRRLAQAYSDSDDWHMRRLSGRILTDAARALMLVRARRPLPPEWGALLEELSVTPAGQLGVMEYLVKQPDLIISAERAALFEQAAEINLQQLSRRRQARLLSALGDSFAAVRPRSEETLALAKQYHRQAAERVPAAAAPAVQAAFRFYQREQLIEEQARLQARHGPDLLTADTGVIEE